MFSWFQQWSTTSSGKLIIAQFLAMTASSVAIACGFPLEDPIMFIGNQFLMMMLVIGIVCSRNFVNWLLEHVWTHRRTVARKTINRMTSDDICRSG